MSHSGAVAWEQLTRPCLPWDMREGVMVAVQVCWADRQCQRSGSGTQVPQAPPAHLPAFSVSLLCIYWSGL